MKSNNLQRECPNPKAVVYSAQILQKQKITFDYAVPIGFQQEIYDLTGENMNGHIVTAYPDSLQFGTFIAVSTVGRNMLEIYDKSNGTAFAEGLPVVEPVIKPKQNKDCAGEFLNFYLGELRSGRVDLLPSFVRRAAKELLAG